MKRSVVCLLLLSIGVSLYAQESRWTLPHPPQHRLMVDLGKGNKMVVELGNLQVMDKLPDMDSLLRVFLQSIEPLKDSLQDELTTKVIDFATDSLGRRKIRVQQLHPKGQSFVEDKGELAALKLDQDTVNFIGIIKLLKPSKLLPKGNNYRVRIFINRLGELPSLVGKLNEKMETIGQLYTGGGWYLGADGMQHLKKDHSIYASNAGGHVPGNGDYLTTDFSVALQNYKNYFVPSFSLGMKAVAPQALDCEIGVYWEPEFFFQSVGGRLQTYRNDFLTVTVGQHYITELRPSNGPLLNVHITFSILIKRQGDYIDRNTYRVGFGSKKLWAGKGMIEPIFYFHDIFKNVTPGVRFSVFF